MRVKGIILFAALLCLKGAGAATEHVHASSEAKEYDRCRLRDTEVLARRNISGYEAPPWYCAEPVYEKPLIPCKPWLAEELCKCILRSGYSYNALNNQQERSLGCGIDELIALMLEWDLRSILHKQYVIYFHYILGPAGGRERVSTMLSIVEFAWIARARFQSCDSRNLYYWQCPWRRFEGMGYSLVEADFSSAVKKVCYTASTPEGAGSFAVFCGAKSELIEVLIEDSVDQWRALKDCLAWAEDNR